MTKAKKPNEIREEVRKQMAAKYKQDVEHWKSMYQTTMQNFGRKCNECYRLKEENDKLKEQVEAQKEWIERLMEFVNMPDDQRHDAVKKYITERQMSEDFKNLFGPYFKTLNWLFLL